MHMRHPRCPLLLRPPRLSWAKLSSSEHQVSIAPSQHDHHVRDTFTSNVCTYWKGLISMYGPALVELKPFPRAMDTP